MSRDDVGKELWTLANVITGFSIAQSLAISVALGTTLQDQLQLAPIKVKGTIAIIAVLYGTLYCVAVYRCLAMARKVPLELDAVWRETTIGRVIAIYLFTLIFVFGLFAPDLLGGPP